MSSGRVTRSGGPHAGPQASGGWGDSVRRTQPPAAEDRRGVAQRQDPPAFHESDCEPGPGAGCTTSPTRGAALLTTFLLMLVLAGLALAVGVFSHNSVVSGRNQLQDKQAFYIAEAGWQRARQALLAGTWTAAASPGNTYTESFGAGEYMVVAVDNGNSTYTITSSGYVPNQTNPAARRRVVETNMPVTSSAGSNLSLAATASASSSDGSDTPEKANDNNTATKWTAGTNGSGSWLAMDYASATTLNRIIVQEHTFIDDLTIEYSDDASSWTAPSGLSISSQGTTWTANFTATSHRYFRARFTDVPSSKKAAVKELESYNASTSYGNGSVTTIW